MRRRDFITLLGGAAFLPVTARAQQPDRPRRIGVLMNLAANDPQGQARVAGFLQGLKQAGWTNDANARIDIRWAAGNADAIRKYAAELAAHAPEVIMTMAAQQRFVAAGNSHRADRVCICPRSGRCRLCR